MLSAGAYGFVMAGTYNTRPMPAEVLVNGKKAAVVRKRQKVKDIWAERRHGPLAEVISEQDYKKAAVEAAFLIGFYPLYYWRPS